MSDDPTCQKGRCQESFDTYDEWLEHYHVDHEMTLANASAYIEKCRSQLLGDSEESSSDDDARGRRTTTPSHRDTGGAA